ncbi:MAG: divalent-cation tolerance protein CutA [Synechococcales bacterium]|nr:divalent-cation tolerance protein CutA [Synechococcales bacterium]
MSQQDSYSVVLVTTASQDEAVAIAQSLIQAGLAACVSITPIQSIYVWEGETHQDNEWQLMIKTHLACFQYLEATVQKIHSYDVPEIIALPILAGSQPYLDWMAAQVERSPRQRPAQ